MAKEVIGSRVKPGTVTLLTSHVYKLSSNYLCLLIQRDLVCSQPWPEIFLFTVGSQQSM